MSKYPLDESASEADTQQQKTYVSDIFDAACNDYDNTALRFFPFAADAAIKILQPHQGWKILDVATGTGALAIALAQTVGPSGRVMGIDLSEGMLARAEHNLKKMGLDNIDLFQMDAELPEFKDTYFDAITCSFGLFFIPDMPKALANWRRVCRPGGKILFTSFTEQSFSPFGGQFFKDLESFDFSEKAIASQRLKDKDACYELMKNAGLEDIEQETVQVGYHLRNADEWWAVIWGSAMRGLIEQLSPNDQQIFHQKHLKNISALQVQDGMWMDVEVRINTARIP